MKGIVPVIINPVESFLKHMPMIVHRGGGYNPVTLRRDCKWSYIFFRKAISTLLFVYVTRWSAERARCVLRLSGTDDLVLDATTFAFWELGSWGSDCRRKCKKHKFSLEQCHAYFTINCPLCSPNKIEDQTLSYYWWWIFEEGTNRSRSMCLWRLLLPALVSGQAQL